MYHNSSWDVHIKNLNITYNVNIINCSKLGNIPVPISLLRGNRGLSYIFKAAYYVPTYGFSVKLSYLMLLCKKIKFKYNPNLWFFILKQ